MNIEKHRAFIDSLSPDLKEKVKELMRDAMDAEKDSYETDGNVDFEEAGKRVEAFRALCAEVKP